ncbi:hypothetical protein FQA39_LY15827 [Lamprigera yunnana]|nr:hypothetical protein FQA39_LY15827 [Lamprigera yunnana]
MLKRVNFGEKKLEKNVVLSVNLPPPVHGRVTARSSSSSSRDRLAVRNEAKELVNKSVDEALCCEDMDVDEETEPSVEEIEAANALMVLFGTNNSSNVPKTFNDFAVQVNTSSKFSLCNFIRSESALISLNRFKQF